MIVLDDKNGFGSDRSNRFAMGFVGAGCVLIADIARQVEDETRQDRAW
jgi:hypothetical protein